MRFSKSRKAVEAIKSKNLRQDVFAMIDSIEKIAKKDKEVAGRRTSVLIHFALALRHTLAERTRQSIVDAIFADAQAGEVPHQWEVNEGFECGKNNDCSKPNQDKTCKRDTSTATCVSW